MAAEIVWIIRCNLTLVVTITYSSLSSNSSSRTTIARQCLWAVDILVVTWWCNSSHSKCTNSHKANTLTEHLRLDINSLIRLDLCLNSNLTVDLVLELEMPVDLADNSTDNSSSYRRCKVKALLLSKFLINSSSSSRRITRTTRLLIWCLLVNEGKYVVCECVWEDL